jgi:hypothetical protein
MGKRQKDFRSPFPGLIVAVRHFPNKEITMNFLFFMGGA